MGIFSRNDKKSKSKTGTTIISNGTVIKGGIDTSGDLYCDGKFEGMIIANSITVGKTGEIIGNINVKNLTVNGLIDGIIDVDTVHILDQGKVLGKMRYKTLTIDNNGIFEGEGKMKNSTLVSQYQKLEANSSILEESKNKELTQ